MMTKVTMMKVTVAITMNHNNDNSSCFALRWSSREISSWSLTVRGRLNIFSSMMWIQTHTVSIYSADTCHEDGWPTYGALNARVTGWLCDEVWVAVNMVDRWGQSWVQASGWRWVGVVASELGTLHMEATCRSASTDPEQKEKLDLKAVTGSSVWLMHYQQQQWALINCNLTLQPAECWRDCSRDALLGKVCTDWRKCRNPPLLSENTMFSQVPPVGFSKSLLPTQSHNSCNNATMARIFKAPTLMEKLYPLTHIPL